MFLYFSGKCGMCQRWQQATGMCGKFKTSLILTNQMLFSDSKTSWEGSWEERDKKTNLIHTLLSSCSLLKLRLEVGVAVWLILSGCTGFFSSFTLVPSSPPPCASSSPSSFIRLGRQEGPSLEKRLIDGRRDGDLSVVESGLWIRPDDEEKGLKMWKITHYNGYLWTKRSQR